MRLMFVGDISLGEHFFSFGHGPRSLIEKGGNPFANVEYLFSKADFVFGNLEGPLSDKGYLPKDPLKRVFRGAPASVELLKGAGINVLNLANNHSLQHGEICFCDTIDRLCAAGLKAVGSANKGRQGQGSVLIGNDGTTIGVIAASDVPDNEKPDQKLYNHLDVDWLCNEVKILSKKTSAVVVILHWGVEGHVRADDEQKRIARDLVRCGAKIIVGHHPHVLFEIEQSGNSLIAYSLGNFVFDLPWDKRFTNSGILDVNVSSTGDLAASLWPIKLNRNGVPKLVGESITLRTTNYNQFNYTKGLRFQAFRKLLYFLFFLTKGDTFTKTRFLAWKIKTRLGL